MTTAEIDHLEQIWPTLAPVVKLPHDEEEYQDLVRLLNALVDEIGLDGEHALASFAEVVGVLIESYENDHAAEISTPIIEASPLYRALKVHRALRSCKGPGLPPGITFRDLTYAGRTR